MTINDLFHVAGELADLLVLLVTAGVKTGVQTIGDTPLVKIAEFIGAVILLVGGASVACWAGGGIVEYFYPADPAGLSPEERKRHQEAVARYLKSSRK